MKKKLRLAFDQLEKEMILVSSEHASVYKGGSSPLPPEFYINGYGDVFINYNNEWMTYSVLDSVTVTSSGGGSGTTWSSVNTAIGIGADANGLVFNIGQVVGNSAALTKVATGTSVIGAISSSYDGINAFYDIFTGSGDANDYVDAIQMVASIASIWGGPIAGVVVNGINTAIDTYQASYSSSGSSGSGWSSGSSGGY